MSQETENLAEGTLISHLLELRDRLMRAFLAVLLIFIPCAIYSNKVFEFVAAPLRERLPAGSSLVATSITATFTTPFKLSFIAALLIAMPYVLYELWGFIAPGLYRREKNFARPLLVSAILLFYVGVTFAYQLVLPIMFNFFIATTPKGVAMMADITNYMDLVLTLVLAFGVAFEVPVAVVLLVLTGLLPIEKLTNARGYVLIGIFVVAAILTPPDALSQTIMAVPMYLLYEGGILFARLMVRNRKPDTNAEESAP